jgi:hypothetical protein
MDALVSDNERVVKTSLAVNSKGGDTTVNLDRGGGADESNGRSDEGEHKKKAKRSHDVFERQGSWKVSTRTKRGLLKISRPEKIFVNSGSLPACILCF